MSKRMLVLMCSIFLVVPLFFMGCGDDGATGPQGIQGIPGDNGATGPPGPGTVSNESCVVCHGTGAAYDVAKVHSVATNGLNVAGTATVTIRSLVFGTPAGNNVPVSVNFDFSATNDLGRPIVQTTDSNTGLNLAALNPTNPARLNSVRIVVARLDPGPSYPALGTAGPNEWFDYVGPANFDRLAGALTLNSYNGSTNVGNYTYTFPADTIMITAMMPPARPQRRNRW